MSETNQFLESDKNNSTETKKTTFGDINSFNETLQEFLKLDQEIKKLYAAVKSRREKKQQLSEIILILLKKNEIESVKSGRDITVHEEVSEVKTGFNRENVNNVLMDYFQNNVEAIERVSDVFLGLLFCETNRGIFDDGTKRSSEHYCTTKRVQRTITKFYTIRKYFFQPLSCMS